MNEIQVKEEIQLIREMIEKTKMSGAKAWNYFFIWGVIGILGVFGMYVLVYFEKYNWIWIDWFVFVGIGVFLTLLFSAKQEKRQRTKTYAHIAISHLSIACGIAFCLVGFVFPLLELYPYGVIPVLISLIAGILTFGIGGIIEWNLLKWCGVTWWLGAVGMLFIHWHWRGLMFVSLLIIGYLVPGFVFRSEFKKSKKNAS